jgi:flavin reductase (DIM6/NTAB) family NADH-FMN oxidoreductase RutF
MPVTERAFREAMSQFATGVTVVTSPPLAGRPPVGVTISSFTSVSLNPPMILWCLDRTADSFPVFRQVDTFAVSVLGAEQEALSRHFSLSGGNKTGGVPLEPGSAGAPLIKGALAHVECRKSAEYDGGDHVIFLGEVTAVRTRPGEPLLYFRSTYSGLGRR